MSELAEDKAKYESLRKDLVAALPKKRALDKQLAQHEANIYALETKYLQETAVHSGGNIIHGFEGYLKNQGAARKRIDVHETDRVFSASSATYQRSLELLNEVDDEAVPGTPNPNSLSTVIIPPAPPPLSASVISKKESRAARKREADREYSRKRRAESRLSTETGSGGEDSIPSTSSRRKKARMGDE